MKSTAFAITILISISTMNFRVGANEKAGNSRPFVILSGAQSHVKERGYHLIKSNKDWMNVWNKHIGNIPKKGSRHRLVNFPVIDFDSCMVIVIFQGRGWNSFGLKATSIIEEKNRIIFRFEDKNFQTGRNPLEVFVYGFFVLPLSTKTIVLEENIQGFISKPPNWKERIKFESSKSKKE